MELKNVLKVKTLLRQFGARRQSQANAAQEAAGAFLLANAQRRVPVDYGILKASGDVRVKRLGDGSVSVAVVYTAKYAVIVHENPDAAHGKEFNVKHAKELAEHPSKGPYRHNRGQNQVYKWLESTAREKKSEIRQLILSYR